MKKKDEYRTWNAWKERKRGSEVSGEFADNVMRLIHQHERRKPGYLIDINELLSLLASRTWSKAGMIAMGSLIGLAKISLIVHAALGARMVDG